jgi:putative ATP-dependent endonuclease of OLD family
MHRFHGRLTADPTRVQRLKSIFDATVGEFESVPEFAAFRRLLQRTTEQFGQNLAYNLGVDFAAYDPSNFFRSLRLQAKLDNDIRTFDELGTGQEQILALAFTYSYARAFSGESGLVLAIDEPESNLHPIAQQWLARQLGEMAAQDGLQVVITTHSPHFVDLAQPESLVVVRKNALDGASIATQVDRAVLSERLIELGASAERTRPETVGAFYSTAATSDIKTGLFARGCILVEGDTERFAFPEILARYGYDALRQGIAFIPVGGVGNLPKWHRYFQVMGIISFPIFDSDSDKAGKQAAERERDRRDLLVALKQDPDLAPQLAGAPIYIGPNFVALDPNFESMILQIAPERWATLATESQEFIGNSKPLQARYICERLKRSDMSQVGDRLLLALTRRVAEHFGDPLAVQLEGKATTPVAG